ncbi:MAG: putative acyl-CoA synthetase [Caulobacteraceae bacterium]|nr:putative acyl-CoA synthetase [Caulobacteraceae bacterium]
MMTKPAASEKPFSGQPILTPTPTAPDRTIRRGDFPTIVQALDYAADQPTGINIHSLRGELVEVLPYAALRDQARALAGRLLALGLAPGDRVAIAADSDGDFLRAFFACQYAGLAPAPVPLPAPFGGKETYVDHVRRMILSAEARAALAPGALAPWFAQAAEGLDLLFTGALADLPDAGPERLPPPDPVGLCYLQFSSGSTRFPIGVAVTQAALMANVLAVGGPRGLGVNTSDRTVSWLPLYHDMGLVGMLLNSLAFQVSVDLLPTGAFVRRPGLWLDLISRRGATISYAPTFGYDLAARRSGAATLADLDLSTWRVAGLGGDMIRPEPLRGFAAAYAPAGFDSRAFTASYGMAEATLGLTLSPLGQGLKTDLADVDDLERRGRAGPPTRPGARRREFTLCGEALVGHRIEVRDETGAPLGERRVGRIFASGPSLMKNYFGEPDETAKALSADGWLDTGDLGYVLGGQIVITGRAKDLIIVNGRNVWPQDLEWTAEQEAPALRAGDVAVFSVHDDSGEEKVVALVQCRMSDAAARAALAAEVGNLLRARHGLEVRVAPVPPHSLPQTSSGKLSRSKAKALYVSGAFEPAPASLTA